MRKRITFITACILIMSIFHIWLSAGLNRWTSTGSGGYDIVAIVFDPITPGTIYVGHRYGIHKSTDEGKSWFKLNDQLQLYQNIYDLLIDPLDPDTLLASTRHDGIFKSMDSGETWLRMIDSIPNGVLEIDPEYPAVIYAGSDGGVYKSTDGGLHWSFFKIHSIPRYVDHLVLNPHQTSVLYAGIYTNGIYKSSDGGMSWVESYAVAAPDYLYYLAIDPTGTGTLYAGVGRDLIHSTDGGSSWQLVSEDCFFAPHNTLVVSPWDNRTMYATDLNGIQISTDQGKSWEFLTRGGSMCLSFSPFSQGVMMRGDSLGLYLSLDAGKSWSKAGLSPAYGFIRVDPADPANLFVGGFGGFSKSSDHGGSWRFTDFGGADDETKVLGIDEENTNLIYAYLSPERLLKSTDAGLSWAHIGAQLDGHGCNCLTIDPSNRQNLYLGNQIGIFESLDGGISWFKISEEIADPYVSISALLVPAWPSDLIFACTGLGLFRKSATDVQWEQIGKTIPSRSFVSILQDTYQPRIIYCSTWFGTVYKSLDLGDHWFPVSSGLINGENYELVADTSIQETVYAVTHRSVFRSQNGGQRWSSMDSGLFGIYNSLAGLAIDPQNSSRLYVCHNGDVFVIDLGSGDVNSDGFLSAEDPEIVAGYLAEIRSGIPGGVDSANLSLDETLNVLDVLHIRLEMAKAPRKWTD